MVLLSNDPPTSPTVHQPCKPAALVPFFLACANHLLKQDVIDARRSDLNGGQPITAAEMQADIVENVSARAINRGLVRLDLGDCACAR
jgi:hypothetical protein